MKNKMEEPYIDKEHASCKMGSTSTKERTRFKWNTSQL